MTDNKFPINLDLTAFFDSLGLTGLSAEAKQKYSVDMQEALETRILNRLVLSMDEEAAGKLNTLSTDDLIIYLADRGINLLDISEEETADYIQELKANLQTANEFIAEKNNSGTEDQATA